MIGISKLTDYGIVLLTHLAKEQERPLWTARDLARETRLPLPTVGKLLKVLSRGDFLYSERGVNGGYRLARAADAITVADLISALEGPIAFTECSGAKAACGIEDVCCTKSNWRKINEAIRQALDGLTLADMGQPSTVPAKRFAESFREART